MAYFMVRDSDLTAVRGPHPAASPFDKRVSENLKLHAFEMYEVELPAGASTEPHDHLEDGSRTRMPSSQAAVGLL